MKEAETEKLILQEKLSRSTKMEAMGLMPRAEALTALMRSDAADGGDDAAPSMQ